MATRWQRRWVAPLAVLALVLTGLTSAASATDTTNAHTSVVSEDPANFTPNILDGTVNAIEEIGNTIYVGGLFTEVREPGGPIVTRNNILAFDKFTGDLSTTFVPDLPGEVETVMAGPAGTIYVGGRFTTANGDSRKRLVQLDLNGNTITAFKANANKVVADLEYINGELIASGSFTSINAQPVEMIAKLDPTTGDLLPDIDLDFDDPRSTATVTGSLSVRAFDVTSDGDTLVGVGNFREVDGLTRHYLVVVDLSVSPAVVSPWYTSAYEPECISSKKPSPIYDIDIDPTDTYFVGVTSAFRGSVVGALCDTAARFELGSTASDTDPTWIDWTYGDSLFAVQISGEAVYVGGHQRWQNGFDRTSGDTGGRVDRPGIAALDPLNGRPLSWNPTRARGVGVQDFLVTDQGLWVGSDTSTIGGELRERIALLPLAGGSPVARPIPPALPADLYKMGDGEFEEYPGFNGGTPGGRNVLESSATWSDVRGAFHISGALIYGRNDGTMWNRGFDGNSFSGGAAPVDLYGLDSSDFDIADIGGMWFDHDTGRAMYTYDGVDALYGRGFTPESMIFGPNEDVLTTSTAVVDWSNVRGMTSAGNQLFYGTTAGNLFRVDLDSAGLPIAGTQAQIGGPGIDGEAWDDRGLGLFSAGDLFGPTDPPPAADFVFESSGDAVANSWHTFTFPVNTTPEDLIIRLDWDDPTARMNLFLKDPSGTTVASASDSVPPPKFITHTANATGTWTMNVKIKEGATDFRILVNPEDPNLWPPADIADYEFSGTGGVGGTTWFSNSFDVTAGEDLEIRIDQIAQAADVNVFLVDPNGTTVEADRSPALVRFINHTAGVTGTWKLNLSIAAGTTDWRALVNPNDAGLQQPAGTLAYWEGWGDPNGDSWQTFDFDVDTAGDITVDLSWIEAGSRINVFLKDPSGTTVANNTGLTSPKQIVHTAGVTGEWQVALSIKDAPTGFTLSVS